MIPYNRVGTLVVVEVDHALLGMPAAEPSLLRSCYAKQRPLRATCVGAGT